jgi:hypothetical protein
MLQDRIAPTKTVSLGINKAERRGAAALEDGVQLMAQIIQARREMALPPTFSAKAMAQAAAATNCMAQAMEHLAAAHEHLAEDKSQLGLDFVAFGDPCPWTLEAGAPAAQPPLRVVA